MPLGACLLGFDSILVTGASGMLGSSIVKHLQHVYPDALLYSIKNKRPLPSGLISLRGSELRPDSFDAVLHLASPASPINHVDPVEVARANVDITYSTLAALAPGGFYAYLSSGEVYGPNAGTFVTEESQVSPQLHGPRSYYPLAKLFGESVALSRKDVRSVVFRVFHTFGPGLRRDDGRSFSDFLWGAALEGKIQMKSDGSATRSFMYVDDFCSAVLLAMRSPELAGIYNVGSSSPMTTLEFALEVSRITEAELVLTSSDIAPSPIQALSPDTSKLESAGWKPLVSEQEAILKTWNWVRSQSGFHKA